MLYGFWPSRGLSKGAQTHGFSDVECSPGPEFEDIDEKLQESFDELLAEAAVESSNNQGLWWFMQVHL